MGTPIVDDRIDTLDHIQTETQNNLNNLIIPNMDNNTNSPSQPHLLNTDTNLSTLSPHSSHTPNMEMMYYPEYNMDDTDREETSSFFSANSSAYDTPKSLTALQAASGLMAKYNQTQKIRKHSKSKHSKPRNSKSRDSKKDKKQSPPFI